MPGRAVADAAEAAARGDDVLLKHALGAAADAQIDIADDAGAGAHGAVFAALAHRRNAGDELGLPQRAQFGRSLGAVHLAAFEKNRGADVVPAREVFEQIMEQVAIAGRSHRWWCGSMIGRSGSMISSRRLSSQSLRIGRWRLGAAGAVSAGILYSPVDGVQPLTVPRRGGDANCFDRGPAMAKPPISGNIRGL